MVVEHVVLGLFDRSSMVESNRVLLCLVGARIILSSCIRNQKIKTSASYITGIVA